jgi:polar amino acid transport system substrate-binding protein
MKSDWTRRGALGVLAGGAVSLGLGEGWAQSGGTVTLAQLRQAKVIKIGIANQPPYSGLNPDGSITGLAPTIIQLIMERLGIPKVEGIIAPYGQLIPGLQAARWDMIGAALTITKQRCEQVVYADPIVADGGALAYVPAAVATPPKSIAEAVKQGLKVGILTGSYLLQTAQKAGVPAGDIAQFQDNPSLIDGLAAKRMQLALSTYTSLRDLRKARNNAFELVYPLPDDLPHGSSPAFRPTDTELYQAFQRELKAMKKSDEFTKLSEKFGFDVLPQLIGMTAEQACAAAS